MFTPQELASALLLLVMWVGWEVGNDRTDTDTTISQSRKVREKRGGQHSLPDVILSKERILIDRHVPLPARSADPNEHEATLDVLLSQSGDRTILHRGMSNDGFLERDAEPGSARDVAGRMQEMYYVDHLRNVALREVPNRNDYV
jgi:hypothetical protein